MPDGILTKLFFRHTFYIQSPTKGIRFFEQKKGACEMNKIKKSYRFSQETIDELQRMMKTYPDINSETRMLEKIVHEAYQRRFDDNEKYLSSAEFAKKINAMSREISQLLLIAGSHAEISMIRTIKDFDMNLIKLADEKVRERMKSRQEKQFWKN